MDIDDKLVKQYLQLLSCKRRSIDDEPEVIKQMINLYDDWQPDSGFKRYKRLKNQFEYLRMFNPKATRSLLEKYSHELWDGEYVDVNNIYYLECHEHVKVFKICNALPPSVDEAYVSRLLQRTEQAGNPIREHIQLSFLLHLIIEDIYDGRARLKQSYPYVFQLLIPKKP
jgi:hypothetical protein